MKLWKILGITYDDDQSANDESTKSYTDMSNEEFFQTIESENAERLGVDEEDIFRMSFEELDKRLGLEPVRAEYSDDHSENDY